MKFELKINGETREVEAATDALLLDVLRAAGYRGVKYGCHEGVCGACTVLVDGQPIYACMTLVGQVVERQVETIEGLGSLDQPHPLQQSFADAGAVQCGFCTPGAILSAKALLEENPAPSRQQVATALDGNLCRCTGYTKIFDGVENAAQKLRGES